MNLTNRLIFCIVATCKGAPKKTDVTNAFQSTEFKDPTTYMSISEGFQFLFPETD